MTGQPDIVRDALTKARNGFRVLESRCLRVVPFYIMLNEFRLADTAAANAAWNRERADLCDAAIKTIGGGA